MIHENAQCWKLNCYLLSAHLQQSHGEGDTLAPKVLDVVKPYLGAAHGPKEIA